MNLPHIIRFFAAVVILAAAFFCAQAALADETRLRGPGKTIQTSSAQTKETASVRVGIPEEIFSAPVRFYQHFLSHQWGWRCAYYPSCSNYALLAIRKHGALIGSVMSFDRLQHEADEGRTSPPILTGGQIKVYDPLENNDYWWYTAPY